ncbi:TadE/TadG family type IV pilus assembly protein [Rhizobium helianthi]|uniref:TadE/TadG family type IV pilus assembly protein n=1 Tax=Rhizobium helianthi TaxID=1132695 RepID=A0ABW4M0Y2_9HYPH
MLNFNGKTFSGRLQLRPFHKFVRDEAGNFGVLSALIMVPLIGIAGLAVDFGMALDERQAFMNAADAAAVGALSEKSPSVAQAMTMSSDGEIKIGTQDAERLFRGQLPASLSSKVTSVSVTIERKGTALTSKVAFNAAIPTTFLRIIGKEAFPIAGAASASYQTNAFIDFFMLLDNTPSMGLGATQKDIDKLKENTSALLRERHRAPQGCAFACHATNPDYAFENTLESARKMGIRLRIDVVKSATQALTEDVEKYRLLANQYQMALYSFGTTADNVRLTEIAGLTTDMVSLRKSASMLDLMSTQKNNYNDNQLTDFRSTFSALKSRIGKGGGGTSASDRQKIVFLVSDGVTDAAKADCSQPLKDETRCMEEIDVDDCNELKNNGIKIGVVYTTYLQMPDDGFWTNRIKPFDKKISPAMQACASPGYFIEASPDQDLTAAMQTLFRKLLSAPRLTS